MDNNRNISALDYNSPYKTYEVYLIYFIQIEKENIKRTQISIANYCLFK